LLALLVARFASVRDFGVFAVVSAMYWLFLGVNRSLVGEPRLVIEGDVPSRRAALDLYASGCVAVLASGVFLGCSVVSGHPLFGLMAGAVFPLLLQDSLRYVFFARGEPRGALALDGIWLGTQALAVPVVLAFLQPSVPATWVGCWGLGALVSLVLGCLVLRPGWSPRGLRSRWRRTRRVSGAFLSDHLVMAGAHQVTLVLLPAVTSIGVVAALKTGQVVNGLMPVLFSAATVLLLPSLARSREAGDLGGALRAGRRVSLTLAGCGGAYLVALLLLLPPAGEAVLGDQWENSRSVIPLVGAQMALMGVTHGAVLMLRGGVDSRPLVLARLAVTPVNIGAPLVGAALGGAGGMGWGMIVAAASAACIWWISALGAVRSART